MPDFARPEIFRSLVMAMTMDASPNWIAFGRSTMVSRLHRNNAGGTIMRAHIHGAVSVIAIGLAAASLCQASTQGGASTTASPSAPDPAAQAQIEAARGLDKARNYKAALLLWRPLADGGVAEAEYALGTDYQYGNGTCQDAAKALSWLQKAADQDYAPGERQLGKLYYYAADHKGWRLDAEAQFLKAANQGDVEAQEMLGEALTGGHNVTPEQYAQAVGWYEKAANQGSVRSMVKLGDLYSQGEGISQDYAKAVDWYRKAAEADSGAGQDALGKAYENGLGVEKDDTQAYTWYRVAATSDTYFSSGSADAIAGVKARLTPAQIETAEIAVARFRVRHPGTNENRGIMVSPVRDTGGCEV